MTHETNDSILEVKNLTIHYITEEGVVKAVNDISFSLKESETLGLAGETGAGKTTTALGLMGLIPEPPGKVIDGQIVFHGKDLLTLSNAEMRKYRGKELSMIFQDPMTALNPVLTVGNQISEVVRLHEKLPASMPRLRLLKCWRWWYSKERMVNIQPVSGGMKQRSSCDCAGLHRA